MLQAVHGEPGLSDIADGGDRSGARAPVDMTPAGEYVEPQTGDEQPASSPDDEAQPDACSSSMEPDELVAAVRSLEQQSQAFHARAENYEQLVRQMQSRIERLQGDQVQGLLKPLIRRVAALHAQAIEAARAARAQSESAAKEFDFFAVAIEEALALVDLESVEAIEGAEFDPRKHHAARILPTTDAALDGRIQRVLTQGFTYPSAPRVLLPAQVNIFRYREPTSEATATGASESQDAAQPETEETQGE